MGWAKYYEDNISICNYNNSQAMREPTPAAVQVFQAKTSAVTMQRLQVKVINLKDTNIGYRSGIMLSFCIDIERSVARRLQMNGWWFSKANSCWCNYNNPVNRQYAQRVTLNQSATITFVT